MEFRSDTMEIEEWKELVLQCVRSHVGATFANLMQDIGEDAEGEYDLFVPGCANLVMWGGLDKGLCDAIAELHREKRIRFEPDSAYLYAMDGRILPLPVAYVPKDYPDPHWCPVLIYPVAKERTD